MQKIQNQGELASKIRLSPEQESLWKDFGQPFALEILTFGRFSLIIWKITTSIKKKCLENKNMETRNIVTSNGLPNVAYSAASDIPGINSWYERRLEQQKQLNSTTSV